jgi:hypothetical protein
VRKATKWVVSTTLDAGQASGFELFFTQFWDGAKWVIAGSKAKRFDSRKAAQQEAVGAALVNVLGWTVSVTTEKKIADVDASVEIREA